MNYHFFKLFPPKTLIMGTSMEGGSYADIEELYRQVLARDDIRILLHATSGAVENILLLKDKSQVVDAGFVEGTVGSIEESSNFVSLGVLNYTPLWIFYRGKNTYDGLSQLQGKRIAIGPEESGYEYFLANF